MELFQTVQVPIYFQKEKRKKKTLDSIWEHQVYVLTQLFLQDWLFLKHVWSIIQKEIWKKLSVTIVHVQPLIRLVFKWA